MELYASNLVKEQYPASPKQGGRIQGPWLIEKSEWHWLCEKSIYQSCMDLVAATIRGDYHFNDCSLIVVQYHKEGGHTFFQENLFIARGGQANMIGLTGCYYTVVGP